MKVSVDLGTVIEIINVPQTIDDIDNVQEAFYKWLDKNKSIWRELEGGNHWGIKTVIYYLENFILTQKEKIEIIDEPVNNNRVKYNNYPVWYF